MNTLLVLGGARSGKSTFAQVTAESMREHRVFIATAEAHDDEMRARIDRHIADRDSSWTTVEAPLELCEAITSNASEEHVLLVDCLTLWLSNLMHSSADVVEEVERLVEVVDGIESPLILVSNEVGLGLVPDNELGRRFRDEQGRLNRKVAAACDEVDFVAAGLPLRLKG